MKQPPKNREREKPVFKARPTACTALIRTSKKTIPRYVDITIFIWPPLVLVSAGTSHIAVALQLQCFVQNCNALYKSIHTTLVLVSTGTSHCAATAMLCTKAYIQKREKKREREKKRGKSEGEKKRNLANNSSRDCA